MLSESVSSISGGHQPSPALAARRAPRLGELTELRRKDLTIAKEKDGAPLAGVFHIVRAGTWPDPDTPIIKEPKTVAGVRDVAIPPHPRA